MLKNPENLDEKRSERERLDEALRINQPLATAYYMKEDLRQIWLQENKATARRVLQDWVRRAEASGLADGSGVDLASFDPAAVPGPGVWAVGDLSRLESAFAKALGTAPPVLLGAVAAPTDSGTASLTAQASTYADAIESASCMPNVDGLILDRLVDVATPALKLPFVGRLGFPQARANHNNNSVPP